MTTYVLILLVSSSNGVTSQAIDFGGREACEAAGNAATAVMSSTLSRSVYYVCAQKNGVEQ